MNDLELARHIAIQHGESPLDILGPRKLAKFVRVRRVIAIVLRTIRRRSWSEIADVFGRSNHTSAMNLVRPKHNKRASRQ